MNTTTAVPAGYQVDPIDPANAGDALIRQVVELTWALDHEAVAEDPRRPFEAVAAQVRASSALWERRRWGAWAGEVLAGQVMVGRSLRDNLHLRDVWIGVHPDHRRRGLARALFATAVDAIGEGEGIVVQSWTTSRVPSGAAFAERVGARPGLRARASQLDLAAIDRALIREWASIDPGGYRLEWIDGETPDRLMDNVVTAIRVMNSMPREDLQWEDWKITPETVREFDRLRRERGQSRRMLLAIQEPTGATAGFTEVSFDPRIPEVLHQLGTAVVPEHRGKGIGKWIKARMVERVLREMPAARYIRTENAGSNAAMLAINVGMGFRPAWEEVVWQMPLADARAYVERRR